MPILLKLAPINSEKGILTTCLRKHKTASGTIPAVCPEFLPAFFAFLLELSQNYDIFHRTPENKNSSEIRKVYETLESCRYQ